MLRSVSIMALLIAALFTFPAQGRQTVDDPNYRIVLADGSTIMGSIQSEDDENVTVVTTRGMVMTLRRDQIVRRELITGRFDRVDPNRTRLMFAPTARPIGSGAGYLAVYELFFPFVSYGAGNAVTLAGGVSLIPGIDNQLFYLAPKVTFLDGRNAALAGGVVFAGSTAIAETGGIAYAVGTFGSSEQALTLGLGFPFITGDEFVTTPIVLVGGELQIANSAKLLSENWVFPGESFGVVSAGIRFFGENLAADFGIFIPVGEDSDGLFLPWLGFAYNFGAGR